MVKKPNFNHSKKSSETNIECSDSTGNVFSFTDQFKNVIDYIDLCKPIIQHLHIAEYINS